MGNLEDFEKLILKSFIEKTGQCFYSIAKPKMWAS